jgi:hypothetical protein
MMYSSAGKPASGVCHTSVLAGCDTYDSTGCGKYYSAGCVTSDSAQRDTPNSTLYINQTLQGVINHTSDSAGWIHLTLQALIHPTLQCMINLTM